MDVERRQLARPVELRAAGDGPGVLAGYAAKYMRYSQNLGGFVEQVASSAFSKSLGDRVPVVARYNHDDNFLLGTSEAETLRMVSDDEGLAYEVDLPDTSAGRDVAALAKRGDLRYSSFAFHTLEDEWSVTEQGFPLRTLLNVQLIDVAPVNSPAYLDTSTGIRSLAQRIDVDPDDVGRVSLEEIRSRLAIIHQFDPETRDEEKAPEEVEEAQGDTHALTLLRQRQLELLK
jgi:HK97 family phage prohead protease